MVAPQRLLRKNKQAAEIKKSLPSKRIFLASDAAYLAAVKCGDTADAQKMVDTAAKAAGFTVGPLWHATNKKWSNIENRPMYFASTEKSARVYAPEGIILRMFLRLPGRGIYEAARGETSFMHYGMTDFARRLDAEGYSAMRGYPAAPGGRGKEFVLLQPRGRVKSADAIIHDDSGNVIPLSERFNEEKGGIR